MFETSEEILKSLELARQKAAAEAAEAEARRAGGGGVHPPFTPQGAQNHGAGAGHQYGGGSPMEAEWHEPPGQGPAAAEASFGFGFGGVPAGTWAGGAESRKVSGRAGGGRRIMKAKRTVAGGGGASASSSSSRASPPHAAAGASAGFKFEAPEGVEGVGGWSPAEVALRPANHACSPERPGKL